MSSMNRNSQCAYQMLRRCCRDRLSKSLFIGLKEDLAYLLEREQLKIFFLTSSFLAELSSDKPCGVHVKSIHLVGLGQSSKNWFDNHMVLFIHMNLEEVWLPSSLKSRVKEEGKLLLKLVSVVPKCARWGHCSKKREKFCRFVNYCNFLSFSECLSAHRVFVIALVGVWGGLLFTNPVHHTSWDGLFLLSGVCKHECCYGCSRTEAAGFPRAEHPAPFQPWSPSSPELHPSCAGVPGLCWICWASQELN